MRLPRNRSSDHVLSIVVHSNDPNLRYVRWAMRFCILFMALRSRVVFTFFTSSDMTLLWVVSVMVVFPWEA